MLFLILIFILCDVVVLLSVYYLIGFVLFCEFFFVFVADDSNKDVIIGTVKNDIEKAQLD